MTNNILFNLDPDRSYDRIVLDYADREWGYYEAENIYINISSGQLISAGLFRRMNARRSDDIILGGRTRGSQQRRRGGEFSTAIPGIGGGPLEIRGVTFSNRFPFKEDAVAEVSYKVFGGVPPYSQSVTWYVNGEVTPGMGGVQPTKRLNLLDKTHGDKFTAKINVSDSQGSRISTLVGATGVIMQPFSWDSLTIQPRSVEPTDSVTIQFEGLTGSSRYLDFGGEPIEFPTGNDETFYLYIGVEESVGQTRATGVPSADGTSSIFDLGYYGEFADNYNFPLGTGLSGAVELSNNAETIIANVTNTTGVASTPTEDFLPLSDLEALINAAAPNSIIDLGGQRYAPQSMEQADDYSSGIRIDKDITLKNGTVSGSIPMNWTEDSSSGIFFADVPVSSNEYISYEDPRIYLIDNDQDIFPYLQARRPEDRDLYKKWNGLAVNDKWYYLLREDGVSTTPFPFGPHGTYTLDESHPGGGTYATSVIADSSVKEDWDNFFAVGADETTTLFHHYPNLVNTVGNASYDSNTGTLTFATPTPSRADQYLNVLFTGLDPNTFLESGEFCFRQKENRIYYRPSNGNPNSCRIPAMSKIFRMTDRKSLTLDNMEVFGQMEGTDVTPGVFSSNSGENAGILRTRNDTIVRHCGVAVFGCKLDLQDSSFYEFTKRFGSGLSSGLVLRNYFGNAANQSILFFGYSTVEDPILVRDNFFNLPATAHGQALSLYLDSWQNATVDHNIFYNNDRPLSMQPRNESGGDPENVGTFSFTNNLIYIDQTRDSIIRSGQSGWAFNGAAYPDIDGRDQKIIITNNSFIIEPTLLEDNDTTNVLQLVDLTIQNIQYFETLMANNIYGVRRIPTESIYASSTEEGVGSFSNLDYGRKLNNNGIAVTDVLNTGYVGVFDPNTLTPIGDLTTAATDGGAIGIRWADIPDPEDIKTLDRTWAADYPALTLPSVSFPTDPDSIIVKGDDKRTGTIAIPNDADPRTDNAYYVVSSTKGRFEAIDGWDAGIEIRWYEPSRAWGMFLTGTNDQARTWFNSNPDGIVRFSYTMTNDGTGSFSSMSGKSGTIDLPVSTWSISTSGQPIKSAKWENYTATSGDDWPFVSPTAESTGNVPYEMAYTIELITS